MIIKLTCEKKEYPIVVFTNDPGDWLLKPKIITK